MEEGLLAIPRCPRTAAPLRTLAPAGLALLNVHVLRARLRHLDVTAVDDGLEEGPITAVGDLAYRVDGGLPILLPWLAIPSGGACGQVSPGSEQ